MSSVPTRMAEALARVITRDARVVTVVRRFTQKTLFQSRDFGLSHEALHMVVRDSDGLFENDVGLEEITGVCRRRRVATGWLLRLGLRLAFFSAVSAGLTLAGVDWTSRVTLALAVVAVACIVLYYLSRIDYLLLETGDDAAVYLLATNPTRQAVELFIQQVLAARKALLREKYVKVIPDNPPDKEIARFRWLLESGIITLDEFNALTELVSRSSQLPLKPKLLN